MATISKLAFKNHAGFSIPKHRLITGIVLGVAFAFALYSFFYLFREMFRLFSITRHYDLLILTSWEVFQYNLFFALISTVFGQSVCFTYWFNRPIKTPNLPLRRRVSIINDQNNLKWYFLYWYTQIILVLYLFFFLTIEGGFLHFKFFPDSLVISALIVLVLFLNNWITLRRVFRKESKKWLLFSSAAVIVVSLVSSLVNLIDYQKINNIVLKKNVFKTYNLELAEVRASYFENNYVGYWNYHQHLELKEPYIVMKKEANEATPIIIWNNKENSIEEYLKALDKWGSNYPYFRSQFLQVRIFVDNNVPVSCLKPLNQGLLNLGNRVIFYAVLKSGEDRLDNYQSIKTVSSTLQSPVEDLDYEIKQIRESNTITNIIMVELNHHGEWFVDGEKVIRDDLFETFVKRVKEDSNLVFAFSICSGASFSDWIFTEVEMNEALNVFRNKQALRIYGKPLPELVGQDHWWALQENYPLRIVRAFTD